MNIDMHVTNGKGVTMSGLSAKSMFTESKTMTAYPPFERMPHQAS